MRFLVGVSWAEGCACTSTEIEAESVDDLCCKMKGFIKESCGIHSASGFTVEVDGNDDVWPFEWTNMELKRSQSLANVWKEVEADVKKAFGGLFA